MEPRLRPDTAATLSNSSPPQVLADRRGKDQLVNELIAGMSGMRGSPQIWMTAKSG